jgi:uncharacterized BrkB/YihY/UPF0761 family membrane protein
MPEQPGRANPPLRLRDWARVHWKWVAAVIAGNFVYFFLLYRWLPPEARHRRNQIDLGLVIDLWVCIFIYGLLEFTYRRKSKN